MYTINNLRHYLHMAAIPRIIPPLSTFDVRVGDLRLDDVVLTGLAQQATLSALS